jgi:hypothetical protein
LQVAAKGNINITNHMGSKSKAELTNTIIAKSISPIISRDNIKITTLPRSQEPKLLAQEPFQIQFKTQTYSLKNPGTCGMECKYTGACKLKITILPRCQVKLIRSRIPGACRMECKYPWACKLKTTILPRSQAKLNRSRILTQSKSNVKQVSRGMSTQDNHFASKSNQTDWTYSLKDPTQSQKPNLLAQESRGMWACKYPGACKLKITMLPRRQVKLIRSRIPGCVEWNASIQGHVNSR